MKKYSNELKIEVVKAYKACNNIERILVNYRISRSTLYEWLKLFSVLNEEKQITYKDYLALQKQLEKKTQELEIMERTHCFKDSPRKQKLDAVERLYGEYPTKTMCRIINLDHGTFLNHHYRRVVETQYDKKRETYRETIKRIFEESEQRFGILKIHTKMRMEGSKIDMKIVSTLYKEMGLKSKYCNKKSFVQKTQLKYNFIGNSLNRQFEQSEPNKFWVGDVTLIPVGSARFYLCVILELFSRKVIAYRLSSQNDANLAIKTFKDAFENRGQPEGLSFHSDKGSGYISNEYRSLLHSLNVKQSCSKSGNPYDNAVIEAFFSNMKKEEINSHNFTFLDELKECVAKYMEYYNGYRPHKFLKNKTPNQVEQEFFNREYSFLPDKSE